MNTTAGLTDKIPTTASSIISPHQTRVIRTSISPHIDAVARDPAQTEHRLTPTVPYDLHRYFPSISSYPVEPQHVPVFPTMNRRTLSCIVEPLTSSRLASSSYIRLQLLFSIRAPISLHFNHLAAELCPLSSSAHYCSLAMTTVVSVLIRGSSQAPDQV